MCSVGLNKLKQNGDKNEIRIVCQTLLKIISKILDKPNESSLRKISLDSDDVLYNLMPYEGALETLFEMGFEEVFFIYCILTYLNSRPISRWH